MINLELFGTESNLLRLYWMEKKGNGSKKKKTTTTTNKTTQNTIKHNKPKRYGTNVCLLQFYKNFYVVIY